MTKRKWNRLLDRMRTPIYVGVILAAIIIVFIDRDAFYQVLMRPAPQAPAASTPVASVSTPSPADTTQSTMLSLDNPSSLPTTTVAEGDIVPFSFTIHNTDAAQQVWYKVSVKFSTGEQDVIDENVLQLAADASQSVPESLKFETSPETATITVQLEGTDQSLTFAIPNK